MGVGKIDLKKLQTLKCLLTETKENQVLLTSILSELVGINENTDNVEPLLTTINTSINSQTTILQTSLQNIEDAINNI